MLVYLQIIYKALLGLFHVELLPIVPVDGEGLLPRHIDCILAVAQMTVSHAYRH